MPKQIPVYRPSFTHFAHIKNLVDIIHNDLSKLNNVQIDFSVEKLQPLTFVFQMCVVRMVVVGGRLVTFNTHFATKYT